FDDDNIVWMLERPFTAEFREAKFLGNIIPADLRAIAAVPGGRAVGNTSFQLWEGGGSSTRVRALDQKRDPVGTQRYYGTEDMLEALGTRMAEGRGFTEEDFRGPQGEATAGPVTV